MDTAPSRLSRARIDTKSSQSFFPGRHWQICEQSGRHFMPGTLRAPCSPQKRSTFACQVMTEQSPNSQSHRRTPGVGSDLPTGQKPGQHLKRRGQESLQTSTHPAPVEEGEGEGLPRESVRLQPGLWEVIERKSPVGGVTFTSRGQPTRSAAQHPCSGGLQRLQPSCKAIYAPVQEV